MDTVGKHLLVSGRVQGVGYRNFVRVHARRLQLSGWVRNLEDGRVELVVQGEAGPVGELLNRLGQGPPLARVDRIETVGEETGSLPFPFRVR